MPIYRRNVKNEVYIASNALYDVTINNINKGETKMEIIINILVSLFLSLSPQVSEAPQVSHEVGIEMEIGVDGCPIEEPCWDYEAEEVSDIYAAFGYNAVEEAQTILHNLEVPPSSSQDIIAYEYVASFDGGTPEFDQTHFTIASSTHEGVEHVFKAVTYWTA
jgi:hypothetical protein